MFFSAKTILEFFQLFYSNFNLMYYAKKNYKFMMIIHSDYVEI